MLPETLIFAIHVGKRQYAHLWLNTQPSVETKIPNTKISQVMFPSSSLLHIPQLLVNCCRHLRLRTTRFRCLQSHQEHSSHSFLTGSAAALRARV